MVLGSRCDSQFNNFAPISQQEVSKNSSTFVADFVVSDDADDADDTVTKQEEFGAGDCLKRNMIEFSILTLEMNP